MSDKDTRIDAYIEKAAAFAQPVLTHLRNLVHAGCPDVVETLKWGCPHFEYKGKQLFHMASFKEHCACGFPPGPCYERPASAFSDGRENGDGATGPYYLA